MYWTVLQRFWELSSTELGFRDVETLEELLESLGVDQAAAGAIRSIIRAEVDHTEFVESAPLSLEGLDEATAAFVEDARLEIVQLLTEGGMGQIQIARDSALERNVVMKILHKKLRDNEMVHAQFMTEAKVTAQLAHPGIPPVHEIGKLGDGRPYFTMKFVGGATLASIFRVIHGRPGAVPTSSPTGDSNSLIQQETSPTGEISGQDVVSRAPRPTPGDEEVLDSEHWTTWRMLEVFQKICEAVGYAHANGVIHGDLKPPNIMVGAFGEVMVMDWGVALRIARDKQGLLRVTNPSFVGGTPAYMPPEQALGTFARLGPPADVFAIGVMLYQYLRGKRPFRGDQEKILKNSQEGKYVKLRASNSIMYDESLAEIIYKAMDPDPEARFEDAIELGNALSNWRAGAMQRAKALEFVERAQDLLPASTTKLQRAEEKRQRGEQLLEQLRTEATLDEKSSAWALEDEALELERQAGAQTAEAAQLLQAALLHASDLKEAKVLLSQIYHRLHLEAEVERRFDDAARYELMLRAYDTGAFARYLDGKGALSLETNEPADVTVYRVESLSRRMRMGEVVASGTTPLKVELPIGSYIAKFETKSGDVFYPVFLQRMRDWMTGKERSQAVIELPVKPQPAAAFVPAGWFTVGGDEVAPGSGPREWRWCDAFWMQEQPVTCGDFSEFLSDDAGAPFLAAMARDGQQVWRKDWPVVGVSLDAARAYADWYSEKTGKPWRLPKEDEWEKAARGADGRTFPWGNFADELFCHVRSHELLPTHVVSVRSFPTDTSPYGVRGMGGNVREWCESGVVRGGSWNQTLEMARCAGRLAIAGDRGYADVGFRLVQDHNS